MIQRNGHFLILPLKVMNVAFNAEDRLLDDELSGAKSIINPSANVFLATLTVLAILKFKLIIR